MTELLNFPDGTVQHAYLTTDNANDDLEIAVLDGDLVILDTNENPVLRWDASATQWDFVSQDVVGVGSFSADSATINNADGSTIDGDDIIGIPGTSSSPSYSIGDGWRIPNADRPVLVFVRIRAQTDGSTQGQLSVDVDESGGTTSDYISIYAWAPPEWSDGADHFAAGFTLIPSGGSYQVNNRDDPNNANTLNTHREWTL